MENNTIISNKGEVIIYQTADGTTAVDVRLENDTVWLSQEMMSRLFNKDRTVIGRHIRNIYNDGELPEEGTCAKFAHMGSRGVQPYVRTLYNLDVIISVGYRVHSQEGVLFRIWATSVLKEYLIKGYAVRSDPVSLVYAEQRNSVSSGRHQARCRRCFGSSNPDDC